MQVRFGHSRLSALLASSSVAALLIGGGAPSAFAQCAISPGTNQSSVSNSAAINCININGITVTGNVTNTGTGTITATGATAPTRTGITINNASVGGAIVNAGTISAPGGGISISNVAQFGSAGGGISNSGTITAGGGAISLSNVTSFYGGIVNAGTGTISGVRAIDVEFGSLFSGGINNSGTLTTGSTALRISGISTFQGGITNSGTISGTAGILVSNGSTFAGGITNSGTIAASVASGISVNGISVFSGGISNSGTISAGAAGIYVSGVATFAGGVTNSGAITGNPGVNFGGSGSLTNLATGVITSGFNLGDGVDAAGILTLTNAGTISSGSGNIAHASYGVAANGGGTIVNSGSITGHWSGIDVHNTAVSVTNSGTITGNRFGGIEISDGVAGTSTINNNNNGLIQGLTGEGYGLLLGSSANIINNVGATIAGAQDIAIYVRDSAVLTALTNAGAVSGLSWAILIQAGNSQITNMSTGVISASGAGSTAIEIDSGDAAISNAGTISGSTTAINVSNATGPDTIDQNAGTMSGAILLSANADVLNINGGTIVGNIVGLGSSDTVNFQTGGTYTDTNTFTHINQVNINSGTTLVLNSTGNSATNVDVGATAGGTLAGTGSLDATTVTIDSGGTLSPGSPTAPLGTFSITATNDLAFDSGSYYAITIAPGAGNNSKTAVTGTAALGGNGTVVVTPQLGHYGTTDYTIMTATPVTGTFAGLVFAGPYAYTGGATLAYGATDVDLDLTAGYAILAAPPGSGQNQQNVVTGIDNYILGGGTLPPGFQNLGTISGPALLNALTQLDGEDATGAQKGAFQLMTQFLDLMLDPTAGGGSGPGGGASGFADEEQANLPSDVALAYARALHKPPQQNFDQRWSAWGSAFGGPGTYDGNATVGSNNVTATDYGYAAGMDYHVTPDTVYGFALGGGGTNWNLATSLGSGRSDSFEAGVYAKTHWGPAYMSGALGFANHWFTTNRIAVGDDLTASFQGQSYAARGEAGYRYGVPVTGYIIGVTPYAALQVQDFHAPGYSENDLAGGGFGLTYNAMNATDTRSELGARFDNLTVWNGMPLVLRGRLAWAHDWVSNPSLGAVFETLPGSNFTVNGAAVPQDSALTTAAAELHLTANWTAIAKFDGEFAPTVQTYAGTGTLRYTW